MIMSESNSEKILPSSKILLHDENIALGKKTENDGYGEVDQPQQELDQINTEASDTDERSANNKKDFIEMSRNKEYSSSTSSIESSSSSKNGDDSEVESSDLDEVESSKLKTIYVDKMAYIEKQFGDTKEKLYKERYNQLNRKLKDVQNEVANEYRLPCKRLEETRETKLQICEVLRRLRKDSIKVIFEAENKANNEHFENDKRIMIDSIKLELEEKIKKLQEDRDNVDYSHEVWSSTDKSSTGSTSYQGSNKSKIQKKAAQYNFGFNQNMKRRKKPITVTGPYIVYMLKENDIMDDWAIVKKALLQRKQVPHKAPRMMKPYNMCRFIDNKLLYNGKWYQKGQGIIIDNKDTTHTLATISSIHFNEIHFNLSDGSSSKLNFNQLQKGRVSMRHKKRWTSSARS